MSAAPSGRFRSRAVILLLLCMGMAVPVAAQQDTGPDTLALSFDPQATIDMNGEEATIVGIVDGVALLMANGPARLEDSDYRRGYYRSLNYRWLMVQDSTMGTVFTEPSGLKLDGSDNIDADIDLVALEEIDAVEVRAVAINIWREPMGVAEATEIALLDPDEEFDFDPRWSTYWQPGLRELLVSVLWVSRVRRRDGSIVEADPLQILEIVQGVYGAITLEDLMLPDPDDDATDPEGERAGAAG